MLLWRGGPARQCSAVGSLDIYFASDHHWGHAAARSFAIVRFRHSRRWIR
jgi:hypothetical protein